LHSATRVLADRMAAALVHHEPGWRLPRPSALARRYNATTAQIETAIEDLVARHLIRRLPDGQLYRASPAEYLVQLAGVTSLGSRLDPMGEEINCRDRHVSWRRVPEEIGRALGIEPGAIVCSLRLLWTANDEPAAVSTTYLVAHATGPPSGIQGTEPEAASGSLLLTTPADSDEESTVAGPPFQPRAVMVEMQPPPPSVARSLRLPIGQPAATVTVRFDDSADGKPTALTVAVLRPDLFRIVIESPGAPRASGSGDDDPDSWTHPPEQ
jgi:DNA-binding GntR family transcriptional regulator